jgi:hypothetical protein
MPHDRLRRRRSACKLARLAGLLAMAGLVMTSPSALSAHAQHDPQQLIVEVRLSAPQHDLAFDRRDDRSYTVSTGGAGSRDSRGGASNSQVLETMASVQSFRVRAGEACRVDLPSVQTLQFHVPAPGASAAKPAATAGASGAGAAGVAPSVAGVVAFESVSAFAVRFSVSGNTVTARLQALQLGGVSAPMIGGNAARTPLVLHGTVGAWMALGDTDVLPAWGLTPTADAPTPAQVWVRVRPDPGEAQAPR